MTLYIIENMDKEKIFNELYEKIDTIWSDKIINYVFLIKYIWNIDFDIDEFIINLEKYNDKCISVIIYGINYYVLLDCVQYNNQTKNTINQYLRLIFNKIGKYNDLTSELKDIIELINKQMNKINLFIV